MGTRSTLDRLNGRLDDLSELYWAIAESTSDTEAEHRGETARFGDSWPGAQLQIAAGRRALARVRHTIDHVLAARDRMYPPFEYPSTPVVGLGVIEPDYPF